MKMNPEEITSIIKERIKNYDVDLNVNDVGTVLEVGDGIAHIYGLDKAMAVFPVPRSPMISSRCPRPIGTRASIAFRPV